MTHVRVYTHCRYLLVHVFMCLYIYTFIVCCVGGSKTCFISRKGTGVLYYTFIAKLTFCNRHCIYMLYVQAREEDIKGGVQFHTYMYFIYCSSLSDSK